MLTTNEVAEQMGVAYTTVMLWIKQGKLPNAVKHEHPRGDYWEIPATDLKTLDRGRKGRPAKPASINGQSAKAAPAGKRKAK